MKQDNQHGQMNQDIKGFESIHGKCKAIEGEVIALRRDFHQFPELGFEEFRTSKIVREYLEALGLDEVHICAKTGVIGVLKGGKPGKVLMLRSDLDALPIHEDNDLPFRSKTPDVMHACGHDGHMAILLGAAKILSQYRESIPGTIIFLFQPNEEDAGAQIMIDDGALDNIRPDAAIAGHLWTGVQVGDICIQPGPFMASSYYFKILIQGKGGHGGAPFDAINPIEAATHVLNGINSMQTLEYDNLEEPTLITTCMIHAGMKENVVPDELEMEGSIRCLHSNDATVRDRFEQLVTSICNAYKCHCNIEFIHGNSVMDNDTELSSLVESVAGQMLGERHIVREGYRSMTGDDFAEFLLDGQIPGVYYLVGAGNESKGITAVHHNHKFMIDEDSLLIGLEMYVRLALSYLNRNQ